MPQGWQLFHLLARPEDVQRLKKAVGGVATVRVLFSKRDYRTPAMKLQVVGRPVAGRRRCRKVYTPELLERLKWVSNLWATRRAALEKQAKRAPARKPAIRRK